MAGVDAQIDSAMLGVMDDLLEFNQAFAREFVISVQQKTPVRTGVLQAGWQSSADINSIEIWNDVDYAEYVENGTPFQAPQGMLARTLEEVDIITASAIQQVTK